MYLSTMDRLIKKLGPVNTLIEKLCAHLLPHEAAHAFDCLCIALQACGVETGDAYALYCTFDGVNYSYGGCGCD